MVYVDEIDVDQEGIAEMMLDENAIAQVARKHNVHRSCTIYCLVVTLTGSQNALYLVKKKEEHLGLPFRLQAPPQDFEIAYLVTLFPHGNLWM